MKNVLVAFAVVIGLLSAQNVFAYDPDALDYSFGTVKKVSATEITLEEYDFEGDLEKTIEVTYVINAETEFDNFDKIEDVKIDEDMEVYFVEENGQKIAVSLAKDEGFDVELGVDDLGTEYFEEDLGAPELEGELPPMDDEPAVN